MDESVATRQSIWFPSFLLQEDAWMLLFLGEWILLFYWWRVSQVLITEEEKDYFWLLCGRDKSFSVCATFKSIVQCTFQYSVFSWNKRKNNLQSIQFPSWLTTFWFWLPTRHCKAFFGPKWQDSDQRLASNNWWGSSLLQSFVSVFHHLLVNQKERERNPNHQTLK